MKPITITLTEQTAEALLWALREHMSVRASVREYVDKRYAGQSEAFRNCKIGEVQSRLDRLLYLNNQIQNHMTLAKMQGEQA
jgi:hypothetical protein